MAKITNDKKLPLGVGIEPSHVAGNLASVATQLSGNVVADQRSEPQAPFSISWFFAEVIGSFDSLLENEINFTLPPLQDHWNDVQVSDENTPAITLDSISFSFDLMNQEKALNFSTGLPTAVDMGTVKLRLFRLTTNPGLTGPPPERVLVAEMVVTGEEIVAQFNTRNPTIIRDLGISMDRWSIYSWQVETVGSAPLFSVLVRGTFLHTVMSRDTEAVLGAALNAGVPISAQNAPPNSLYGKDNAAVSITAPAADALVQADAVGVGVQAQVESIDTVFQNKLVGGRSDRYQSDLAFATDRKEQLYDDAGYFCWCVNLMKLGAATAITGANAAAFQVATAVGLTIWDRALIPITYPGTIHHVLVEAAGNSDWIQRNPGAIPIANRSIEVGVGLYRGVRMSSPTYTQVAYLSTLLTGTVGNLLTNKIWQVPLVYSTAAGVVAGKGFVAQGRPVYFGRQLTYSGAVAREPIADGVASLGAEIIPPTAGLENFIEVRLNYLNLSGATWATGLAADAILGSAGFNVYIIGKMGLKE